MASLGAKPERTVAAIGPCIGAASYEVGEDLLRAFAVELDWAARFFAPAADPARRLFDIAAYVRARLGRAGLTVVEGIGGDTFADEARFFSYRRATRRSEPDYGRMLSAIGLPTPAGPDHAH
jgi:hypothetical protein